jgi:hypothetical protein
VITLAVSKTTYYLAPPQLFLASLLIQENATRMRLTLNAFQTPCTVAIHLRPPAAGDMPAHMRAAFTVNLSIPLHKVGSRSALAGIILGTPRAHSRKKRCCTSLMNKSPFMLPVAICPLMNMMNAFFRIAGMALLCATACHWLSGYQPFRP